MRVSLFRFKNCLGIDELEVKPGKVTVISGGTGKGKTSVLETFVKIFTNKGYRPKFVKGDAEKAETYILLDDGTEMKKTFNQDGKPSYVSVTKDGMSPKSVETFLKSLISDAQINPIKWMELPDNEQNKAILETLPMRVTREELIDWVGEVPSVFGEEIDLAQHALKVCKDVETYYYEKRKTVNAELNVLKADVTNLKGKLPEDYNADTWRNISLTEKYETIRKANETNKEIQSHQDNVNNVSSRVEGLRNQAKAAIAEIKELSAKGKKSTEDKIAELKRQITILEGQLSQADAVCAEKIKTTTEHYKNLAETAEKEAVESKKYLETYKIIDIEPLEKEHAETEKMKSFIRTYDELQEKSKRLGEVENESTALTNKIELMRAKPQALLSKANMPVDGLSVDASGNVLINNLPIKNLSDGEKMEFVMNIVKATAGPLKLILVDGFEKLSPERQKSFIDNALKDEFHYIVTKVTDGDMQITLFDNEGG